MTTILCAEIVGNFSNNGNTLSSSPQSTYIELPKTLADLRDNLNKLEYILSNKYKFLQEINKTVEDEQPIAPGIYIITQLMVMDDQMTKVFTSNLVGYNVVNQNNRLSFYNENDDKTNSPKSIISEFKEPQIFITPDGVGFY